ncbi:SMI1/KNR4 family protein [Lysinibacillus cavernae]|uniref:SMI1/KNR4 family protein n=1 Tax=Lysinibacillus cavernae TaxID=2666135 RepID=UPI0012D8791E|nr:SMI1/KNR4 family protein [Lysinibacillus cavernae]
MERLQAFLLKKEQQTLVGKPAIIDELTQAQQLLHVHFHEDYVQFIEMFGGAYAGLAIHAFSNGSSIGNETVVDLTLDFRQQYKDWLAPTILDTSYVISMDGGGNPIFIDSLGKVFICYHDSGEIKQLANSFELLIEENFCEW